MAEFSHETILASSVEGAENSWYLATCHRSVHASALQNYLHLMDTTVLICALPFD